MIVSLDCPFSDQTSILPELVPQLQNRFCVVQSNARPCNYNTHSQNGTFSTRSSRTNSICLKAIRSLCSVLDDNPSGGIICLTHHAMILLSHPWLGLLFPTHMLRLHQWYPTHPSYFHMTTTTTATTQLNKLPLSTYHYICNKQMIQYVLLTTTNK